MMRPKISIPPLVLLLVFCWSNWAVVPVQAQAAPGVSLQIAVGFDGFYKQESTVPIQVSAANVGPPIEGRLQIMVGSSSTGERLIYESPVSLPTQSDKRVTMYVDLPRFTGQLTVDLLDDEGRTVTSVSSSSVSVLTLEDLLYGVVSSQPGEFVALEKSPGRRARAAVAFLDLTALPEAAPAWNGLDVLVFNDVDTSQLTIAQRQALAGWISTGGQLVVTGGPGWQKTVASLAQLLPVDVAGNESVGDLPTLREHAGVPFRDAGPYLVSNSSLVAGELLLHEAGLPLLARRSHGRGAVYFLALDPQLAPLLDWDGQSLLWSEISGRVPDVPPWGVGVQSGYAAATAVSSLPTLALPSFAQLVLFLTIYVLLIGPVNYLVLNKMSRRELAWATVPALVVLFSGAAYLTGFQLKGNKTILNEMSIAFGQIDGEQMRVQSLIGLYSPRRASYDLTLPLQTVARPFERNFGTIGGGGNVEAISRDTDLTISDVKADVSEVQTFIVDSYQAMLPLSGNATLALNGNDIELQIQLENRSDHLLENAALLLGSRVLGLGDIEPGNTLQEAQFIRSAVSSSLAPSGPIIPGSSGSSPLTTNADVILGTTEYYNDRNSYPRWQLLQSLEGTFYGGATVGTLPTDAVTLIAWSDQSQVEATINRQDYDTASTTLYFLEIPLEQQIVTGGNNVTLPVTLLSWEVLSQNNVFDGAIQNLFLNGGWIEFEYLPWPEFQRMTVTDLAFSLEPQPESQTEAVPHVRLWDWQEEVWITQDSVSWGTNAVAGFGPFIGNNNAVRLRLEDSSQFGVQILEVYPVLTGSLRQ